LDPPVAEYGPHNSPASTNNRDLDIAQHGTSEAMKGNGQTNGIWHPSSLALPDKGIIEALVRSGIYRKFTRAFTQLTGLRITLLPAHSLPLPKRSIPVYRAGRLVGFLQTTCVESAKSQNKRSLAGDRLVEVFAKHLEMVSEHAAFQALNGESPIVRRVKGYIHTNYATDVSLSKTASSLNVSRFYLCKLFRKATGFTLSRYVSAVRVDRAKLLLLDRSLRVSEIAFDVGFQSLTHFNRAFRNTTGRSPTEYRKRATVSD
jgi:AraC-like DNA-binding protein